MAIKILPQHLINKIAAGEVVERPASVVKELVENSIDAKAKNISIEIVNGGMNLIKITDDGIGMNREDARLSVAQHATSKITTDEDLFNISSLGFRGEALASISAVSDFSLKTKTAEALSGVEIIVKENQMQENEIGCSNGTQVTIKELFVNVPARRKYLKTSVTEFNHIVDLFLNFVLAYKNISWKLIHNTKTVYQFAAVDDLQKRMFEVFGQQVSDNLLTIDYNGLEVKISGYIGKPQIARNNRKLQYLFINGRAVNDYIISAKVKDAFGQHIFHNLYPVFVLFVNIDTQKVDVNVHPRKMEVRFSEPQKIYSAVYRAVADVLDDSELTKNIQEVDIPVKISSKSQITNSKQGPIFNDQKYNQSNYRNVGYRQPQMGGFVQNKQAFEFNQKISEPLFESKMQVDENLDFKIIGQVALSYLIVETDNSMKIYDQHACSERVQYQKIKEEFLSQKISRQQLLIPENIELTAVESSIIKEKLDVLERFGFELSELSSNAFMVNSVPQLLAQKDYKQAIKELVGKIVETGELEINNEINEAVDAILKMMSCRSAIKFGDKLSYDEMVALLTNLEKCDSKFTCVHGRPNVIEYSFDELEKLFKRKG